MHGIVKGNQLAKQVTDVGAGAGSQSLATDTHLVLRPHEQQDGVVRNAVVRSLLLDHGVVPDGLTDALRWFYSPLTWYLNKFPEVGTTALDWLSISWPWP